VKRAAIATAILCIFAIYVACKPNQAADQKTTSAPEKTTTAITTEHEQSPTKASDNSNSNPPKWCAALKRPEWWLVGVGVITFIILAWQSVETRIAAEATRDSVLGIKRQADIMERQSVLIIERERPRIFVKVEERPEFNPDGVSILRYKIECFCPTPAFIGKTEVKAYTETKGTTLNIPEALPISLNSPIKETNTLDEWVPIVDWNNWARISETELKDGKIILYCAGTIEYRGVHLLPTEPSYKTSFSKKWTIIRPTSPNLEVYGYWDDYPDEKANQNT
jgi:hypothetical protein